MSVVWEMRIRKSLNALGEPQMEKDQQSNNNYARERKAPGIITRKSVMSQFKRYKSYRQLLPIGRGQRELIIGIDKLVKHNSSDTILNQGI